MPTKAQPPKTIWTARLPIFLGFLAAVLLIGVLGYWSVAARISGAVIASGMIQVETNGQVVQHPDGGVIKKIFVKDGNLVSGGDVLLRLDDTLMGSELAMVEGRLFDLLAQRARLHADRDAQADFAIPDYLSTLLPNHPKVQELYDGQEAVPAGQDAWLCHRVGRGGPPLRRPWSGPGAGRVTGPVYQNQDTEGSAPIRPGPSPRRS